MERVCPHPPAAHHYDRPRGIVTCMQCGDVVTEEAFEMDPAFARGEKSAPAARGAPGFARPPRGPQLGPLIGAARPSIEAARRSLAAIARQLDIPPDHVEIAAGVYKIAVGTNAVAGARSPVLCACLYIVCRRKQTPHMVLDFSDVTGDSPFFIMKYLRLIAAATGTAVPPVDPSCYLIRLAQHLDLKEMVNPVALFALKVLRAMKQDWIHTGRKPLGPCAAALIVACRAHGINRSATDLADAVRLGEGTIMLRLQEFLTTEAAQLKDIDQYQPSEKSNPSAFTKGRAKDTDYAFLSQAMTLSAMYWELVGEAREGRGATQERQKKWTEFWTQREELKHRGRPMDPQRPIQVPDLASLTADQQLDLLGLPRTQVVTPKTEEEYTQELSQMQSTLLPSEPKEGEAGAKEPPADASKDDACSVGSKAFTLRSEAPTLPERPQPLQSEHNSQHPSQHHRGQLTATQHAAATQASTVPRARDRLEIIVLPNDDGPTDEVLAPYIIDDLELRLQKEKLSEKAYGEELWKRGAPKEIKLEPEDPRYPQSRQGMRKRPRKEIVESATAAESIAARLKAMGGGQISVQGLAKLLPERVRSRAGGSHAGSELAGSLDDEWPID